MERNTMRPKPTVLVILDGWGVRDTSANNAIASAKTPNYDDWWKNRPRAVVQTCANYVGLPRGQMGNSEVGHMNLGAGRIVFQDFTRISNAVEDGSFLTNPAVVATCRAAAAAGGAVHIMALLSPGGVHSHTDHMLAAVKAADLQGVKRIFVHGFLDGRDTPPRSALEYIDAFEKGLKAVGAGRLATITGRYWAMDRDKRWERVSQAYDALTLGRGAFTAESARAAVEAAYGRDENDEFVKPTVIVADGQPLGPVNDGDAILMMNFRADRVREISQAFIAPEPGSDDGSGNAPFEGFKRQKKVRLSGFLTLTLYAESLKGVAVAYPPQSLTRLLGEEVSRLGMKQLRAAETEKYAHVTYFFNGGVEEPFPGEDRLLVPSPKVATYDLKPEMSARELTDQVVERIKSGKYDLIVLNYANPDMVGHTGFFDAAVRAIEVVDECLGRVASAVLEAGGEMLITSDHGNADQMLEESTGEAHTAHTNNPGPFIYLGHRKAVLESGSLCDVAPTLLDIMGMEIPDEMSGRSLITFN
ncbi:MAG: 2,3-bisphosphoglycerate-independent phosphoglycerate mutase [Magnetococcales bacterium]|nr:2,3-bisphosphoglycerate-independent phosphoglycerate mutase [Magnetococcales bacterium]MBF0157811.1 2,3-bisphosphoglycerate-independent phosphoglycerate mutase [Magnetococcales bacterium]